MPARSLSSKMASSVAKSAAAGVEESSMLDMILMGAGVVVIILLLVYIYNRFIHKQPAKHEDFRSYDQCNCCACSDVSGECIQCQYGYKEDGVGCKSRRESNNMRTACNCECDCGYHSAKDGSKTCGRCRFGRNSDGTCIKI